MNLTFDVSNIFCSPKSLIKWKEICSLSWHMFEELQWLFLNSNCNYLCKLYRHILIDTWIMSKMVSDFSPLHRSCLLSYPIWQSHLYFPFVFVQFELVPHIPVVVVHSSMSWSHDPPCHPSSHVSQPVAGLQVAFTLHLQTPAQFTPQVFSGQPVDIINWIKLLATWVLFYYWIIYIVISEGIHIQTSLPQYYIK